jgi:hypothetical protein
MVITMALGGSEANAVVTKSKKTRLCRWLHSPAWADAPATKTSNAATGAQRRVALARGQRGAQELQKPGDTQASRDGQHEIRLDAKADQNGQVKPLRRRQVGKRAEAEHVQARTLARHVDWLARLPILDPKVEPQEGQAADPSTGSAERRGPACATGSGKMSLPRRRRRPCRPAPC